MWSTIKTRHWQRVWLAWLVVCGLIVAPSAHAQTVTFGATGGEQSFTVPADVSSLQVTAVGARGGFQNTTVEPGGFGAVASANLPVAPGQLLYVEVGGNGGSGPGYPGAAQGGFNGGGAGGSYAGAGGGASDVRTASSLSPGSLETRLIVAGGGGGAGNPSGGGNAGSPGPGEGSGSAGTQTGGGAGGVGGGAPAGSPGALGMGGAGGGSATLGGAGGGGGLYGGGGGVAGTCVGGGGYCTPGPGGSGGGGSSGFAATATATEISVDQSGSPSVLISYKVGPSRAQIKSSLRSQLAPHGKTSRIKTILAHRGYTLKFMALTGGTATIAWFGVPRGAHIAFGKALLVGTGMRLFSDAGSSTLTIHLKGRGRALLQHVKHIKLMAKGSFKPRGASGISVERSFTLAL